MVGTNQSADQQSQFNWGKAGIGLAVGGVTSFVPDFAAGKFVDHDFTDSKRFKPGTIQNIQTVQDAVRPMVKHPTFGVQSKWGRIINYGGAAAGAIIGGFQGD